jgi:uncharacterized membrane protein
MGSCYLEKCVVWRSLLSLLSVGLLSKFLAVFFVQLSCCVTQVVLLIIV